MNTTNTQQTQQTNHQEPAGFAQLNLKQQNGDPNTFNKRTKRLFMGFAAVSIAMMTFLL